MKNLNSNNKNRAICPFCGEQIIADSVFCPSCGKKIRKCYYCGGFMKEDAIYCVSCGNKSWNGYLFSKLIDICTSEKNSGNKEKADKAETLYGQLMSITPDDKVQLSEIAMEIERDLGVIIINEQMIEELKTQVAPTKFIPNQVEKWSIADKLYSEIVTKNNLSAKDYIRLSEQAEPLCTRANASQTKKKGKNIGFYIFSFIITLLIFVSIANIKKQNKTGLIDPPKELTQDCDSCEITEKVLKYNKHLPIAIGNGLKLVNAKYDTDAKSLVFSIEGTKSITYEKLQKLLPQIKSKMIVELKNAIEKKYDPLIMSAIVAGSSINYIITVDTINIKITISQDDLKRDSKLSRDVVLAKEYLNEYAKSINSHLPDIDNSGEGMLRVKYDVDNNILIWYCLTTCDKSHADAAYNQTLSSLRETYLDRTDAVVDAIVESNGRTQFIYQNSKGKVVFSFVITGEDIYPAGCLP